MRISLKTQKMLWGRAANRCSICRRVLVVDASEIDDESVIGDVCHIVAESPSGPRGDSPLSLEQRAKYDNLILLCKVHHKIVDDQSDTHSVERLKEIKTTHEQWVRESLEGFDAAKQRDDEIYAGYIEEWAKRADIENWPSWSYSVVGPQPRMRVFRDRDLEELRFWLLSRVWPKQYVELETAFENYRHVLEDFQIVFRKYARRLYPGDDELITEKIYKIPQWDPELYSHLGQRYDFHCALVKDLMLELTRAANYICDKVREHVFLTYRLREGVILVASGPYADADYVFHRVEYQGDERMMHPYPGLDQFKTGRKHRDEHFGEGVDVDDPEFWVGDSEVWNEEE